MAALFPMQWPKEIETFFAVQSAISSASQALLSPDCELSWMSPAEAFYRKQVGFALLPFTIVLCCTLVWRAARMAKCKWVEIQNKRGRRYRCRLCSFYKIGRCFLGWFCCTFLPHGRQTGAGHARLRARG